jgi:pyrrolidone-carboxylate peptidase
MKHSRFFYYGCAALTFYGAMAATTANQLSMLAPQSDIHLVRPNVTDDNGDIYLRPEIYIAGFGPWGDNERNQSGELAYYLGEQPGIMSEVLEVDFKKARKRLIDVIHRINPKRLVLLGISEVDYLSIIPFAINKMNGTDNSKRYEGERTNPNLPYYLILPQNSLEALVEIFDGANIRHRTQKATEASKFLCNASFFTALEYTRDTDIKSIALHISKDSFDDKGKRENVILAINEIKNNYLGQ